jgi:hypothetical protein
VLFFRIAHCCPLDSFISYPIPRLSGPGLAPGIRMHGARPANDSEG